LEVDAEPGEGVAMRMSLVFWIVAPMVGRMDLCRRLGNGVIHFGEGFFGVAGRPLGVVEVGFGGVSSPGAMPRRQL
jgi:hypothetical protein